MAETESVQKALRRGDPSYITVQFAKMFIFAGAAVLLLAGLAAGLSSVTSYNWLEGVKATLRVLSLGLILAGACAVTSFLFGLLFGVPKSLAMGQGPRSSPSVEANVASIAESVSGRSNTAPTSRVNTNLEDISDWLTKTIVGVGLTQLFTLPDALWSVAGQMNLHGFNWVPHGQLLALAIMLYFGPGGFWLGYVLTRTILTKLFDDYNPSSKAIDTAAKPENLTLQISEKGVTAAKGDLLDADRILLNTPLQSVNTPQQMAAWGAAQARSGNLERAELAFKDVLRTDPGNQGVKEQLATVYVAAGKVGEAERVAKDVPNSKIAMYTALYQPGGYERAIELGETLLKQPSNAGDPHLRVWLACAYGQKYRALIEGNAQPAESDRVKSQAISEIKAAVALDSRTGPLLRSLWIPPAGNKDDDLSALPKDDPELRQILGAP